MAIRKILTIPDSILRQKSLPVDKVNKEIKTLMDDMLNTMYDAPGIGLAAIQTYSTVYIITENRVIIKTGAALSFLISMPFKKIKEVNLQKRGGSVGTISFELFSEKRVPYISCWPSVRPWRFKKTQPAFSCIGSVDEVATTLRKTAMTGNISLHDPRQNLEIGSEIEQKV